mmetsp:Transcript_12930/g.14114  ORF Transcript_12930/g.14114 Transcript_12930/m.14114 type:complete len:190 (+) Transcript_12930:96-665(+)
MGSTFCIIAAGIFQPNVSRSIRRACVRKVVVMLLYAMLNGIVTSKIGSHQIYTISIWWQVPQFIFIAAGEIFLISTSYEVAYTHAPSQLKTVASAVNLCFMAIAYAISAALFGACASWLPNFDPNDIDGYMDHSHYDYYYYLLIGVCLLGSAGALALIPYYRRIERDHQAQIKSSNSQEPISIDSDDSA